MSSTARAVRWTGSISHYFFAMHKDPKYWCPKRVAKHLGLENARTAAKLLRTGEIEGFKISGRYWRTTEWQVEAYARRRLELQRWKLRSQGKHAA